MASDGTHSYNTVTLSYNTVTPSYNLTPAVITNRVLVEWDQYLQRTKFTRFSQL